MSSLLDRARCALPVSPGLFRRIALATLVFSTVIIFTGGVVRLTQSGLGCPTFPDCTSGHFVAGFELHPMIEFTNRVVTFFAGLLMAITWVFALLRRPSRRDLVWWSLGLVIEVVAESVLGGISVLEKLAPPFVMAHFLLALVVLWNAVVIYHKAGQPEGRPVLTVSKEVLWLSRVMFLVLGALVFVGTVVAGTGPYSGSPGTERLHILSFLQVTYLHADIALIFLALTLADLFLLHQGRYPLEIQRAARSILWLGAFQGMIGYIQYFTHLPQWLISLHILGAAMVWLWMNYYYLLLFRVPRRQATADRLGEAAQARMVPTD